MSFAQVRIDGDICLKIICDRDRQDIVLAEVENEVKSIDNVEFLVEFWTKIYEPLYRRSQRDLEQR